MDTTVQKVQRRLIALGFDVGSAGADGISGRMTIAAITAFQKANDLDIQYPGTIGAKTLAALEITGSLSPILPPWVAEGQRKLGLHEKLNNAALKAYLKSDGQTLGDPSKLPWCGDFIETIIALTLPKEPMVVNPYWAANWLKFGKALPEERYYLGAIGVKSRTGGNHVFTIVGHDKVNVHGLGGNQSDSISVVKIPKTAITGMRWPSTYPFPTEQMPLTTFTGKMSVKED